MNKIVAFGMIITIVSVFCVGYIIGNGAVTLVDFEEICVNYTKAWCYQCVPNAIENNPFFKDNLIDLENVSLLIEK